MEAYSARERVNTLNTTRYATTPHANASDTNAALTKQHMARNSAAARPDQRHPLYNRTFKPLSVEQGGLGDPMALACHCSYSPKKSVIFSAVTKPGSNVCSMLADKTVTNPSTGIKPSRSIERNVHRSRIRWYLQYVKV